jgi:hypothetical protein
LPLSDFYLIPLSSGIDLSGFDCEHSDINEFLKEDALDYQKERMANTYLFLDDNKEIVAFFSISNDCLTDLGAEEGFTNTIWNRFHRRTDIPNQKRIRNYPAVKIGRLGVCIQQHKSGLAYELMDFIKGFAILDHKPGCRLLLLDAYNKERQLKYYQKNGFQFLLDTDKDDKTRIMYFDLQRFD